ncbi:IclR family transcriptional regulator [Rhodopseudomonas palustris]|nr:IclR family transcriptional regulator [Rhodopseudomonas palustris]
MTKTSAQPADDSPLERYFKVLESVAISGEGAIVTEIATNCQLPLGTAHRLLQNLLRTGLLTNKEGRRKDYQLGERLLRLLHAGTDSARLAIAVQPILDQLANQFDETCYLARLVGHQVVSVAWAAPNGGLRGHVVPGHILAPHVAASAKAILAFQSDVLIDRILSEPLPQLTPETKVARGDVERDYAQVRDNQFATCWNEMEVGFGAIAVPIPIPDIGVIYSVGTAGFTERLSRRPVADFVGQLQKAVEPLVRALREPSAQR